MAYRKAFVPKKLFVPIPVENPVQDIVPLMIVVHPIQHLRTMVHQNCFTRYFGVNSGSKYHGKSSGIAFMVCVLLRCSGVNSQVGAMVLHCKTLVQQKCTQPLLPVSAKSLPSSLQFISLELFCRVMPSSSSQVPLTRGLPVWVKMLNLCAVRP